MGGKATKDSRSSDPTQPPKIIVGNATRSNDSHAPEVELDDALETDVNEDGEDDGRVYHRQGLRARFLTSADIFAKRASRRSDAYYHAIEQFQSRYVNACTTVVATLGGGGMGPNEAFQQCFETLDDNPKTRARALVLVAERFAHDVLNAVTARIDDLTSVGESNRQRQRFDEPGRSANQTANAEAAMDFSDSMAANWLLDEEPDRAAPAVTEPGLATRVSSDDHPDNDGTTAALSVAPISASLQDDADVGVSWIEAGFFLFLWNAALGDKIGRGEAKGCRAVVDLMQPFIRVPLAYHVTYKGRSITAVSVAPIDARRELLSRPAPLDYETPLREIAAAFNLRVHAVGPDCTSASPPELKLFRGHDARRYMIGNLGWMPKVPLSDGSRYNPIHEGAAMSMKLLIRLPADRMVSTRTFHVASQVADDDVVMNIMCDAVDSDVHNVPHEYIKALRVAAQERREGHHDLPDIISLFRNRGFGCHFLGVLLMSLLRNVSPPRRLVDDVIVEIMARGLKGFIRAAMCEGLAALAPSRFDTAAAIAKRSAHGADAHLTWLKPPSQSNETINARFNNICRFVLANVVFYAGREVPREANAATGVTGIVFPQDIYAGVCIPFVYSKFRLQYDDVDLFQQWPVAMRRRIYEKLCGMLGVIVKDGVVATTTPVLGAVSTPPWGPVFNSASDDGDIEHWVNETVFAPWVELRRQYVISTFVETTQEPRRTDWEILGISLVPLLRLGIASAAIETLINDRLGRFFDQPHHQLLLRARSLRKHEVQIYVESVQSMPAGTRSAELAMDWTHALRRLALAHHDCGEYNDARSLLDDAASICKDILTEGNRYCAGYYRRVMQDLAAYRPDAQEEMLSLLSKHCPGDQQLARDFIRLANHTLTESRATADLDPRTDPSGGGSHAESSAANEQDTDGGGGNDMEHAVSRMMQHLARADALIDDLWQPTLSPNVVPVSSTDLLIQRLRKRHQHLVVMVNRCLAQLRLDGADVEVIAEDLVNVATALESHALVSDAAAGRAHAGDLDWSTSVWQGAPPFVMYAVADACDAASRPQDASSWRSKARAKEEELIKSDTAYCFLLSPGV